MSTNPYAGSQNPFGESNYMPPAKPTPVAGMVFGILHLVFGALGLCGSVFGLIFFFMPITPQMTEQNPAMKLMVEHQFYRLFIQGSAVIGLLATIALIAAGIGLLMVKPFGRQLSIGYAIYALIMLFLGFLVNLFIVFPVLLEQFNNGPEGPQQAGAMIGIISGAVTPVIGLIYPGLILYFMFTPKMIEGYTPRTSY